MNEPYPPPFPPQPPIVRRRKGLGCFATGCLIVVIILMFFGVLFGGTLWVVYHGGQAYISDQRSLARTLTPTDEEYQSVLAKLAPFGQAMNEGHAATLEITPDDLNVLIARSPQFEALRGQLFLAAADDGITAEVSTPLNDDAHAVYFSGRATLDASYASNGFAFFLRSIEPLDKPRGDTLFGRLLNSPAMRQALSQQISRGVNDDIRKQAAKDPATADLLRMLRTIVVQKGKFVITIGERPGAVPSIPPAATPVAMGANQT